MISFKTLQNKSVLTSVVSIDRDIDLASKLHKALIKNRCKNILIVTRESDINTIDFWKSRAKIITVPHYDIVSRHNFDKLVLKRQIVLDYAKNNHYDALWFVDSDIIPKPKTLINLKTKKDICLAPYQPKWGEGSLVGIKIDSYPYVNIHKITSEDKKVPRKSCIVGGFGCTLIMKSCFDVKIEYQMYPDSTDWKGCKIEGEDVGFFLNCYKAGLTCEYLTRWEQPHYCYK